VLFNALDDFNVRDHLIFQIDWYSLIDTSTANCYTSLLIDQIASLPSSQVYAQLSGSICNSKSIIPLIIHRT
jgi:hypothetical protein